eukprot:5502980-Ditylum_brightwellii.AAC.1
MEEFPGLVPDAIVVQSLEAQENAKPVMEAEMKKVAAAAEAELKKIQIAMEAELKKAKIAAEQSTNKVKTMQANLEAMKTEITMVLRSDLSTMVKEATEEAVDAAKDKLRGYTKMKLTTMVSSVEMHISSLPQKLGAKLDSTPTKDASAMPTTIPNQNIAYITSNEMDIGRNVNYAHYPLALYHLSQYTPTQMPPVADQLCHTIQQYYGIQGSSNTTTSSEQLTNGQDKH